VPTAADASTLAGVEPATVAPPIRTRPADAFMRRLLRVRTGEASARSAENVFGASLLLSTVRCLLTYVLLPLLKPVVDLSGGVGPVLGLLIGTVSAVAIVASMRRFWAADHRLRWAYTSIGGAILVLLAVGAVGDVVALL
jgi:hypothetical protein